MTLMYKLSAVTLMPLHGAGDVDVRRKLSKVSLLPQSQADKNLAVAYCAGQLSPHDQLLVLHASGPLTVNWREVSFAVLQVLQWIQLQQGPLILTPDHLLHRLVQ